MQLCSIRSNRVKILKKLKKVIITLLWLLLLLLWLRFQSSKAGGDITLESIVTQTYIKFNLRGLNSFQKEKNERKNDGIKYVALRSLSYNILHVFIHSLFLSLSPALCLSSMVISCLISHLGYWICSHIFVFFSSARKHPFSCNIQKRNVTNQKYIVLTEINCYYEFISLFSHWESEREEEKREEG